MRGFEFNPQAGPTGREVLDADDPDLVQARLLYEATQAEAERIPWHWIERAVANRRGWRPGRWCAHLILADGPRGPAGFVYGAHVPGYGGYVCYLGVDAPERGRGVGSWLFGQSFRVMAADAGFAGESLPFVVWESRRPEPGAARSEWDLWAARLRVFERVGAWWVEGVMLHSPNYGDADGPPLPLQIFLAPQAVPAGEWDSGAVRDAVAGLLRRVYHLEPGDELFDRSLPPESRPRLRPIQALRDEDRQLLGDVVAAGVSG
jgi:hypothetical protein